MSNPGAHALTPIPTRAVTTASPTKMPSIRTKKATSADRSVTVVAGAPRGDHLQGPRDDVERARNLAGDLAVQRHIHRIWRVHLQTRDAEDPDSPDPAVQPDGGIQGRAN